MNFALVAILTMYIQFCIYKNCFAYDYKNVKAVLEFCGFKYQKGKLRIQTDIPSEQIDAWQDLLYACGHGNIPDEYKYNDESYIILDGYVIKSYKPDKFGQMSWLIKPTEVYAPPNYIKLNEPIVIFTPKICGVKLKSHFYYRLYAFNFELMMTGKGQKFFLLKGQVLPLKINL